MVWGHGRTNLFWDSVLGMDGKVGGCSNGRNCSGFVEQKFQMQHGEEESCDTEACVCCIGQKRSK